MNHLPRLYGPLRPTHYQLALDIDSLGKTFHGQLTLQADSDAGLATVALHAKDLVVTMATVDGTDANWSQAGDVLSLTPTTALDAGTHTITIEWHGAITDTLHGLYPCHYAHDNERKEVLVTQFESHHAREVFPCIDEPEAKATFGLQLTTQVGVTVLGNMPATDTHTIDNRLVTTFATTPRMSSYLLAFVIGDLHAVEGVTAHGVEVRVWATLAQPTTELAWALQTAIKSVDYLEDYFGVTYPLPKLDHVAVPDFMAGAMENWGLITYREIALLAGDDTSIDGRQYVARVIAHETSHQWFGNLVTMKWWDDLWLNESFANLMEYAVTDALYPEWNSWVEYASQETFMALHRDWLPGIQSVYTPVDDPEELGTLFDPAIVYAKGGRLLAMLRSHIGEAAFRAGLSDYFARHAYGNTTGSDLWQAFARVHGSDVSGFMQSWLTQPHYPAVTIEETATGYHLSQAPLVLGTAPDLTWPIPLGASLPQLPHMFDTPTLEVAAPTGSAVLLNGHNAAHFVPNYSETLLARLCQDVTDGKIEPVDRLALLHETGMLAQAGHRSSASLIDMLPHYHAETNFAVWDIIARSIGELKRFVEAESPEEQALRRIVGELARPLSGRLGFVAQEGDNDDTIRLRVLLAGLLVYADDTAAVAHFSQLFRTDPKLEQLSADDRLLACMVAVKQNHPADIEQLFSLYHTTINPELRSDIVDAITGTHDPALVAKLIDMLNDRSLVKSQDLPRWFGLLIRSRFARTAAWDWVRHNWDVIDTTFGGDKSYDHFPRIAGSSLANQTQLEEYRAFFGPLRQDPALTRIIEIGEADIAARIAWLDRDTAAVRSRLMMS
jgi:aminopeptidase N